MSVCLGVYLFTTQARTGADRAPAVFPQRSVMRDAAEPRSPSAAVPSVTCSASDCATEAVGVAAAVAPIRRIVWDFPEAPGGELRVLVAVPPQASKSVRLPVLVALHGRGEALKGAVRGARGWLDDYELANAITALSTGSLSREDYHGFVDDRRLREVNDALRRRPYQGMVVVMPYTPLDITGNRPISAVESYGRFLVETVLPRVYRETPAIGTAQTTGIDGVSLGGRIALLVGLSFPASFGAIGSLQAAVDEQDAPALVELARRARLANPYVSLRLLTSEGDAYLRPLLHLSQAWKKAGVGHEFRISRGPHDYAFNRGPGALEMLFYHDAVLRVANSVSSTEAIGPEKFDQREE